TDSLMLQDASIGCRKGAWACGTFVPGDRMIFNVGDVLPARHDMATVIASYIIAVLGSYTALFHAQHMFRTNGSLNPPIAIGAAVSLGGIGIWTTHFTGMVAYRLPFTVMYEGFLTATSL